MPPATALVAWTVTVAVLPVTFVLGATVAVMPAGAPLRARLSPSVYPADRVMVTVELPLAPPAVIGSGVGANVKEMPDAAPPVMVTETDVVASGTPVPEPRTVNA